MPEHQNQDAAENRSPQSAEANAVVDPAALTHTGSIEEPPSPGSAQHELHITRASTPSTPSSTDSDSQHGRIVEEIAAVKGGDGKQLERPQAYRTLTTDTEVSAVSLDPAQKAQAKRDAKPWYKKLNPLKWGPVPPMPEERVVSREYQANLLSKITFQWVSPLMTAGYRRTMEVQDIWTVNPARGADVMAKRLQENFHKRVDDGHFAPLAYAIYDTYKFEFWLGGLSQLVSTIFMVMSPFTMRYLIQFATENYYASHAGLPLPPIGHGIGLVVGILIMQVIQSIGTNQFIYRGMMIGGQTRAALTAMLLEKSMKLSGRARAGGHTSQEQLRLKQLQEERKAKRNILLRLVTKIKFGKKKKVQKASGGNEGWSNGRIVNLMSTDTYRIDQASGLFHMLWTSPVAVLITLVVLLVNLTYSALSGFALLMIAVPLLTRTTTSLIKRRKKINIITDERVSLTQEIIQSVRFVKFFGWESSFLDRLYNIRKREISGIQILMTIRNAVLAVSLSMPIFASMLSFITYSLSNHNLAPAPIFSSLALFNSLRLPLNLLPLVIGQVTDAVDSVSRIQDFMLAEEQPDDVEWDPNAENAVDVTDADFTWEKTSKADNPDEAGKSVKKQSNKALENVVQTVTAGVDDAMSEQTRVEPFKLQDINFSVGRKELVAVIGTVGSGKSSILAALAGDMRKTRGTIRMGASRAFCPQYAWIQNASVKENILFGKEMNPSWYNEVIDACALRADLDMLPAGDLTEIGERGITVSGGQKQRMNIARAIYFDSDIVIMDDPLSAVDAHVGRHIFDNAICGLLKDKCRILATHQLHVLHRCDRIVWVEDGKIIAIDTFDNLMNNNAGFQKLMATTAQEEEEEQEKAVVEDEVEAEKKDAKRARQTKKQAALMQKEERATKSVSWSVYSAYLKAAGGLWTLPVLFLLLVISQGSNIVTSLWLSWWTSNKWGFKTGEYIGVYAGLGVGQALLTFTYTVALAVFGTNASKILLHKSISATLRAPMSFFDTTPLGRITNRFAKDVDTMDTTLADSIRMFTMTMASIVSVFILIIAYYYYFAAALGPLCIMFLFSANFYRASAREMKRHEAVLRSDVFAKFAETVSGISSIRAYGLQEHFNTVLRKSIDNMDSAYFLTFANQRWLGVRIDFVGNILVFVVGILVVTNTFQVDPAIAGLVLSYILSIVQMMQFTIRQLAEVENAMNATERINYYATELDQEPPAYLPGTDASWPQKGEIDFDMVKMRYRDGLPLVLQEFDLHVKGGERVGIVGRTGAGKSSIMSTLFRLVELSGGKIKIDGVDIAKVGLQDLRSRLSIIPQDPTLFKGTIRSNLDPFGERTDLELWSALRQAGLVDDTGVDHDEKSTGRIHLDSTVEEEGLNFSLGQRQLMALARALVRGSQIIVCDEATSSVDVETDQNIQRTIATAFRGKTLLCIAHRLKTIIGYDRICVMDAGRIAELGTPLDLWKQGGIFRGMCERSGIRREDFDEMRIEYGDDKEIKALS